MTSKTRGVNVEREKGKPFSTLKYCRSCKTMHREKKLEDRPKSAKISHYGSNHKYLTILRFTEQTQTMPSA